MTCTGCSSAVERALKRAQDNGMDHTAAGISRYDVDLEKKRVTVWGTADEGEVLEKIAKTGKAVTPVVE
ncbi:hypothetical protein CTheo_928 [Ceratobasidium theobromae]|uniref:HMA domain-containing protein n=1 Tax=Ceratobasidium theobromae TaxID=1582974 RepID=A0A5N5QVB0_9AGAM|nr:hypothetical protein CTheo_928 [Ceratobasidium theobromae]